MSAIVGNQRKIVKDMVLGDYRLPKGVSTFWTLQDHNISIPIRIPQTRKQFDTKSKILQC